MEVDISGAKVFFTIPIDFPLFGKIQISETLVVSWIVMALITGLCIWLTRDLKIRNISKRQAVAEMRPQINSSSATWEKNSGI